MAPAAPKRRAPWAGALVALALGAAPSCARPPAPAKAPAAEAAWQVRVEAGPGGRELAVEADLPRGVPEELGVGEGAEPFVRGVEIEQGGAWAPVAPRGDAWLAPACAARGCRVRYRFSLAEAAAALDNFDQAEAYGGEAFLAPPSTWLLRPLAASGPARVRLRVVTPPGVEFITGLRREGEGGPFVFGVDDLADAPYSGFGRFRVRPIEIEGGGRLDLAFTPGAFGLDDERLAAYVASSAAAVAAFYGRFPVERALVVLTQVRGRGVPFGKTSGNGGAAIVMLLGESLREADLRRDWVMVHEMVHLGFPWLPGRHRWLEEGLATYVEPLVRLRAGLVAEEDIWREFVERMPQGLPRPGDRGLDRTPTWGRTYWGGAIFCLLADVEIRKRTGGARSLEDALRGVVRAGGNASARWGIGEALAAGDAAVGVPVLRELYDAMAERPAPVDLPRLWRELGVRSEGGRVRFDDRAPLAAVREGITGGGRGRGPKAL
ncbi:MAG TPA: hypothetical protein VFS43_17115 [Polyangiaceae bacterium]|nr:hypothetical protein [Polyangiaceae bacterium]